MPGLVYATWEDVVASYEYALPVARKPWVEDKLRRGSVRLRQLVPSLDTRMALPASDPQSVDPEVPETLLVEAVLRLVRNPTGAAQQQAGPFSLQLPAGQAAEIRFDEAEVHSLLDPPADAPAGSLRLAVPLPHRPVLPSTWLPRA